MSKGIEPLAFLLFLLLYALCVCVCLHTATAVADDESRDSGDNQDDDEDVVSSKRARRMRMYADDVTDHKHASLRYHLSVCLSYFVCLAVSVVDPVDAAISRRRR